jgi:hypothetical protein
MRFGRENAFCPSFVVPSTARARRTSFPTSTIYIYFYKEPKSPGSGFGTGLVGLVSALNTDLDWLREHTRYLQRATEWDSGGKPAIRLLSGPDIAAAKGWAARRPKNAPELTPLQLDFIKASEAEEVRQQSAEAQRLKEMAEAQDERARALAEREEAQKREVEAQKREAEQVLRNARRTRMWLGGVSVLALVAVGFAFVAYQQREAALQATTEIQRQLDRANQALAESIDNDLGLKPNAPLDPRQRQALWKLTFAGEAVKSDFIDTDRQAKQQGLRR